MTNYLTFNEPKLRPCGTPHLLTMHPGSRDISLKYALTLSAESIGCVLFFILQLGQQYLYGESVFLALMGAPSILAAILAFFCFR